VHQVCTSVLSKACGDTTHPFRLCKKHAAKKGVTQQHCTAGLRLAYLPCHTICTTNVTGHSSLQVPVMCNRQQGIWYLADNKVECSDTQCTTCLGRPLADRFMSRCGTIGFCRHTGMSAESIWRSSFKVDLPGTALSCSREGLHKKICRLFDCYGIMYEKVQFYGDLNALLYCILT